ncbi:di-trans,poly-cis-decaprenylcistransferase [Marispirochaeta aestuarii]|uniref:Isoprenyl transferase n=1 Tax=Marispirochaeta aestuarii TaxID=1963862 RepID=A0A1Y1RWC8_9SPIO|nr:polyprenyl diphosphate synthase [Marispirochaeta aestuarii]ORC33902.1 di-trans,poly-cis-decaprenylcistransferase [Marispirochaeta aestuarii]
MAIIDPARLPKHIGIIMDGNGRWAKMRKMQRTAGHKEGLTSAKAVIGRAAELGIQFVTLYTFSTENWRRSQEEVHFLFNLINVYLRKEMDFYREKGIRVIHTGDTDNLPEQVRRELISVGEDTAGFTGLTVNIAINYGGRDQILRAINRLLEKGEKRVDEESLRSCFDNPELPDADLIIRTAGEKRLSNFLLWESAYAELYFSEKLWPDWRGDDLDEAIEDYQGRTRRYGGAE